MDAIRVLAVAAAILISTGAARAATFMVGPGSASSCGQFAEAYQKDPLIEFNFFFWAQGWLSAENSAEAAVPGRPRILWDLFAIPVESQMMVVRQYCNEHPLADYAQAIAFLRDSKLKRVTLPALPAGEK